MIIEYTHQSNNLHQEDLAPRDNELLQVFHQSTMSIQREIISMFVYEHASNKSV
jgi:hypothetical protein